MLGESLRRDTSLARFVLKRMTRLLPVFWLAVLLGAATHILVAGPPIPGASDWLNGNRAHPVSASEVFQNLTAYAVSLNGSLWSIQVELIMIPILPLMVYVSGRLSWAGNVAVLAALCVLSRLVFTPVRSFDGSQLFFLAYLNCFYAGIALPKLLECRWRAYMTSGTVATCGLALSIHLYKYWPHWGISIETKLVLNSIISGQIVAWVLTGRESRVGRLLQSRPLARLGDWSYSFYCFALPVMVIVTCLIMERVAPSSLDTTLGTLLFLTMTGVLTSAIVLPISYCSFRFIEAPLTQFGRKLATRCANNPYFRHSRHSAGSALEDPFTMNEGGILLSVMPLAPNESRGGGDEIDPVFARVVSVCGLDRVSDVVGSYARVGSQTGPADDLR